MLIAAGRLRRGALKELADEFQQRITLPLTVREIDTRPRKSGNAGLEEVENRFLDAVPERAHLILLDETGEMLSSAKFASHLQSLRDGGVVDHLALAVGGPDGHGERLKARANEKIAFGRMTWPHLLARVMVLEQIYRVQSIWAGSPYHRE